MEDHRIQDETEVKCEGGHHGHNHDEHGRHEHGHDEHDHHEHGHHDHGHHDHDHHDHGHHDHDHHDHDHHDHEHDHGVPSLEMSSHEQAVIATVRCVIPGEYGEAVDALKDAMRKTAAEIEDNGGLIGHVKAFAREENRSCMISIPEADDVQVREAVSPSVHVECANIVFSLTADRLEAIVRTHFAPWLS